MRACPKLHGFTARLVVLVVLASASLPTISVSGQSWDRGRPSSNDLVERQVHLMEQALQKAVGHGVNEVERQLTTLVPGLVLFAGSIQVRGFVLTGYGLFFDVEYPISGAVFFGLLGFLTRSLTRVLPKTWRIFGCGC